MIVMMMMMIITVRIAITIEISEVLSYDDNNDTVMLVISIIIMYRSENDI